MLDYQMGFGNHFKDTFKMIEQMKASGTIAKSPSDIVPFAVEPMSQTWMWPRHPPYELTEAAFSSVSYACIKKRSVGMSSMMYKVQTETNQGIFQDVQLNHWLYQLLKRPNPQFRTSEFYRLVQEYLDFYGNAYIYAPKSIDYNGKTYPTIIPTQMWVLQSPFVQLVQGPLGPEYYKYTFAGHYEEFEVDEIIHLRTLYPGRNIRDAYIGKAIIESAATLLLAEAELSAFFMRYAKYDTLPPLMLLSQDQLHTEEMKEFKTGLNAVAPNVRIAANLYSGMQLEPASTLGIGGSGVNLDKFDESLTKKICGVFGVPFEYYTGESTTQASAIQQKANFYDMTIQPLAQDFVECLTDFFNKRVPNESNLVIKYQPFNFTNSDDEIKLRTSNIQLGISSIEYERQKQGIIIPKTDTIMVQTTLKPLSQVLNPPVVVPNKPVTSSTDTKNIGRMMEDIVIKNFISLPLSTITTDKLLNEDFDDLILNLGLTESDVMKLKGDTMDEVDKILKENRGKSKNFIGDELSEYFYDLKI